MLNCINSPVLKVQQPLLAEADVFLISPKNSVLPSVMAMHRGFRHKHTFLLLYKHKPVIFTLWLCWEKSCADKFFNCWETSFCVYFYCLHNKGSNFQPTVLQSWRAHVYPTGESHDSVSHTKVQPHVYQPVLFVQIKNKKTKKVPTVDAEATRLHLDKEKHPSRSGQETLSQKKSKGDCWSYQVVSQSCDAKIKQLVMELKIGQPLNHQTAALWGRAEAEIQFGSNSMFQCCQELNTSQ